VRVFLVGFGPFPGAPLNPSAVLAKELARRRRPAFAGVERTAHVFPTTYTAIDRRLPNLLAQNPDILLMFGLARRQGRLCIEMQARNVRSVLFPDAAGYRPQSGVIAAGRHGPLRASVPFARLLDALRGCPIPVRLSRDAGRYLCNYAYWRALRCAPDNRTLVQFIHIPPLKSGSRPRRRSARHAAWLRQLLTAAERLLVAVIAVRRHSWPR
jgi:pyroglutamyl-peptidase